MDLACLVSYIRRLSRLSTAAEHAHFHTKQYVWKNMKAEAVCSFSAIVTRLETQPCIFVVVQAGGRNPVKQAEEALNTNSLLIHTHLTPALFAYDALRPSVFAIYPSQKQTKAETRKVAIRSHSKQPSFNSLLTAGAAAEWRGGYVTSSRQGVTRGVVDVTTYARDLRCKQTSVVSHD